MGGTVAMDIYNTRLHLFSIPKFDISFRLPKCALENKAKIVGSPHGRMLELFMQMKTADNLSN